MPSTELEVEQDCRTALLTPRRLAFATDAPAEAHERAQEVMAEHRMTLSDRSVPFSARVHQAALGGVRLLHFDYGSGVRIASAPLRDFATVHVPLAGAITVGEGAQAVHATPGHAVVFSPTGDVRMRWSAGLRMLVVRIERESLEARLRSLLDVPLRATPRFAASLDLSRAGRGLLGALAAGQQALATSGPAGPPPLVAAELERAIVMALLLGQPHTYSDALRAWPSLPAPRVVDAALARDAATPGALPTLAELAAAAGVSERALHLAFRRRFGASPVSYLRGERLRRAREDLQAADPADGTTVARVALDHGFAHPGRFAAAYRARFGEPPGDTLRRT